MHNARNMRKIRTLEGCLHKVKGVKLYWKNGIELSDGQSRDEGLYNELKAWKPASGSKVRAGHMQMKL